MEKRAGHGKGKFTIPDYSGSSLVGNVGLGVGHGYGPILRLERFGVKPKCVSSSPAFEVPSSIGYALGHGRCFYRSHLPFVDPFIYEDDDNDEQNDPDGDIIENRRYRIRHEQQQGEPEIESSSSSDSDESSTVSSRPDSGIGL